MVTIIVVVIVHERTEHLLFTRLKLHQEKVRHTFVTQYTAGKVLMFATSKGPDQMPIEVNTETSFDFPGQ